MNNNARLLAPEAVPAVPDVPAPRQAERPTGTDRAAEVLCVDLDGTLIRSDLLIESLLALVKRNPLMLLLVPLWLLGGKANLKHQIARRVDLDVAHLPYNSELLNYLRQQKLRGSRLVLATAANDKYAHAVAAHLDLFDEVIASDQRTNLAARAKLAAIQALIGDGRTFDYCGNDHADLAIWARSRRAVLVDVSARLRRRFGGPVAREFKGRRAGILTYLQALRLHQWLKNGLVFLPLLAAHEIANPGLLGQAVLAFFAFGLCASGTYVINDLLDLQADRQHPRKRHRPFASGAIPLAHGAVLIPTMLGAGAAIAAAVGPQFALILGAYLATTLAYSFGLKRVAMLDVLVLASLYTLRMIAGAAATGIEPSFWLLAFSMFVFLSLAFVKRYTELVSLQDQGRMAAKGRGYRVQDLHVLQGLGTASGYVSVMVLALYVNNPDTGALYQHPQLIWLLCPVLLYWISRLWIKSQRGEMHDDPLVFAIKDRVSQLMIIVGGAIMGAAV